MRSARYFATLLLGIVALTLGVWFVYSNLGTQGKIAAIKIAASELATPPAQDPATNPDTTVITTASPTTSATNAVTDSNVSKPVPVTPAVAPVTATTTPNIESASTGTVQVSASAAATPEVTWQPTPRSLVRDSAYVMTQSGRVPGAISTLERWVNANPGDTVIVADLARLLAREQRHGEAHSRFAQLVALDSSFAYMLEAADAFEHARDSVGAVALLSALAKQRPNDAALTLRLALNLERIGRTQDAIEQYSRLIARMPIAELLLARGRMYLWSGDVTLGVADLRASVEQKPLAEALRLLGDHYRWEGDVSAAGKYYRRALQESPGDSAAQNGLTLLDNAIEVRLLAASDLWSNSFGARARITSDNAGFGLASVSGSHAFPALNYGFTLSINAEVRSLSVAAATAPKRQLAGYGADATVTKQVGLSKLSVSLGAIKHDGFAATLRATAAADALLHKSRLRISAARLPAYESLWSRKLVDSAILSNASSLLSSTTADLAVAAPFAFGTLLNISGGYLRPDDGNSRFAGGASLRAKLSPRFWVIYAGSTMSWDQQVDMYYSPARFTSHSFGLEYSLQHDEGLSLNARVLPGYAWMREVYGIGDPTLVSRSAFQFVASTDLVLRRSDWDFIFTTALGAGREGGYHSGSALLQLRRSW